MHLSGTEPAENGVGGASMGGGFMNYAALKIVYDSYRNK